MWNTIILLENSGSRENRKMRGYEPGTLIWGKDETPHEAARYAASDASIARMALLKLPCVYSKRKELTFITERALMWCETDEDGEFISGADYEIGDIRFYGSGKDVWQMKIGG